MPLLSLGVDCETAYQIRRVTGETTAQLFDWLITPIESCGVLLSEHAAWFRPGNWEIVADGARVRDKGTGLEFQHEFAKVDGGSSQIDVTKVEAHLDAARSKHLHLKSKTLNLIRFSQELYFIRKEWWADAHRAATNAAAVLDAYKTLNPNIKVVIVSPDAEVEALSERHMLARIKPGETWSGDDESWDRVFSLVGAWREQRLRVAQSSLRLVDEFATSRL